MEFFTADIFWLFFAYGLGTLVGWYFAFKRSYENVVGATIDSLIENGYLKTRNNESDDVDIIPWKEWCDDQTTR